MLKRALAAGAAALMATACADTSTDPAVPIQAAVVAKVSLCHLNQETGQFEPIIVSGGGKAYQKHLAHGDGEPGGPVPGMPGYVFDDACGLAERVFAIAYTDVDPSDGPGFKAGTDVLISKLIDANGDGVVSVGDQIVMDRYPTNFEATQFGGFGVTTHTVTDVVVTGSYQHVVRVGNALIGWADSTIYQTELGVQPFEAYVEYNSDLSASALILRDDPSALMSIGDWLDAVQGGVSSQPDTEVHLQRDGTSDDGFLDVEINVP